MLILLVILYEIVDKVSSWYVNGYMYLMIEIKGVILMLVKVLLEVLVFKKVLFRNCGSLLNK